MQKILAGLAALVCLQVVASAEEDKPAEEIVVTGRASLLLLRHELVRAEDQAGAFGDHVERLGGGRLDQRLGQKGGHLRCDVGIVRPAGAVADIDAKRCGGAEVIGHFLEAGAFLAAGDDRLAMRQRLGGGLGLASAKRGVDARTGKPGGLGKARGVG